MEQKLTSETGLHSLVSSSFAQGNIQDEIRNDSYIKIFYVMNFPKASWQIQLKFCQVQTSYQLIEIQMVFYSNKNHTHNIQQIKVYYAYQEKIYNLIQDSKG